MNVVPGDPRSARSADEPWQPEKLPPLPGDEWKGVVQKPQTPAPVTPSYPTAPPKPVDELPARLRLAFAPLHKRAFGTAVGAACALLLSGVTAFHVLLDPPGAPNIWLLGQYFYGYSVSAMGVLIGGAWAFGVGFVAAWFFAFCRNLTFAASIFVRRTRAELAQTRDFLDHI